MIFQRELRRLGDVYRQIVFDSGAITPQGKDVELVKQLLGLEPGKNVGATQPFAPAKSAVNNKVFVVYGHDEQARARLDAMLRRWGLEPLILDQLPSEGQTIIEKLEKYTGEAKFGVVLATPDDEGFRRNHPDEKALRARQNVVLELGMLLSTLGRSKVAILLHQQENMERPSDIQGSAGILRLKTELIARLNGTIEEGVVKDILFGEIIVQ